MKQHQKCYHLDFDYINCMIVMKQSHSEKADEPSNKILIEMMKYFWVADDKYNDHNAPDLLLSSHKALFFYTPHEVYSPKSSLVGKSWQTKKKISEIKLDNKFCSMKLCKWIFAKEAAANIGGRPRRAGRICIMLPSCCYCCQRNIMTLKNWPWALLPATKSIFLCQRLNLKTLNTATNDWATLEFQTDWTLTLPVVYTEST